MTEQTTADLQAKDAVIADLATDSPAYRKPSARDRNSDLHQIVVVGGGAAGLELATKLGDTFGRRREAACHAWSTHPQPSVEAAAA